MEKFLGAAVTALELEQLQAVVLQLSQEVGAERVIEACAAQAALTGKPNWLAGVAGFASVPAGPPPTAEQTQTFYGVIGMCDDETFGECMATEGSSQSSLSNSNYVEGMWCCTRCCNHRRPTSSGKPVLSIAIRKKAGAAETIIRAR